MVALPICFTLKWTGLTDPFIPNMAACFLAVHAVQLAVPVVNSSSQAHLLQTFAEAEIHMSCWGLQDVSAVKKQKSLGLPNSLEITCNGKTAFFTSFLSREDAYRLITGLWAQQKYVCILTKDDTVHLCLHMYVWLVMLQVV